MKISTVMTIEFEEDHKSDDVNEILDVKSSDIFRKLMFCYKGDCGLVETITDMIDNGKLTGNEILSLACAGANSIMGSVFEGLSSI